MKKTILIVALISLLASCAPKSSVYTKKEGGYSMSTTSTTQKQGVALPATGSKPIGIIPNATAFRMSGDYSNNVAVTLSPNGELLYFPAPSDITAYSEPIELGEGWWLNCQGLGPNSVFTKYTFAEYASMAETPTPEQIKMAILPGARVTGFMELPMKLNDAIQNIDRVKSYLKNK